MSEQQSWRVKSCLQSWAVQLPPGASLWRLVEGLTGRAHLHAHSVSGLSAETADLVLMSAGCLLSLYGHLSTRDWTELRLPPNSSQMLAILGHVRPIFTCLGGLLLW